MHRRGCPRPCVMAPTWRPLPYVLRFVGAGGAGWLVKVSIPPPTPPPPPPPPGLMRESAASGLGGVWSTLWNLSHVADRSTVPALAPARYGTFYFVFISCLRPVKITLLLYDNVRATRVCALRGPPRTCNRVPWPGRQLTPWNQSLIKAPQLPWGLGAGPRF